jgi:hypothetical protein
MSQYNLFSCLNSNIHIGCICKTSVFKFKFFLSVHTHTDTHLHPMPKIFYIAMWQANLNKKLSTKRIWKTLQRVSIPLKISKFIRKLHNALIKIIEGSQSLLMASNKGRIHAWISFSFVHVIFLHFFVFVYIAWVPSDPLVKKEQILTSSFVLLELVFIFGILIEMPNSKQECSLQFAFFMVWNALFSLILSRGINDFFRNFADFVWPPFVWVYAGFHWR